MARPVRYFDPRARKYFKAKIERYSYQYQLQQLWLSNHREE